MILLLLFLTFITTQSAPVGSPSAGALDTDLAHYHSVLGRELPECLKLGRYRTTSQILWSCLATIFACTWTAVHPNLSGPRDSGFQRLRRRLVLVYCMIIAPELATVWAMRQRLVANKLKEFNNRFNDGVDPTLSIATMIKQWFTGSDGIPRKGWTVTHGFFIQMGGFMLYDNGKPVEVLTFERMLAAIEENKIDVPFVPEGDIIDKSKGDFLTKLFVVAQTTWFVVQCTIRWRLGLPLAELEVLTLAFAALNGIIYGIWFDKPQGVQVPIRLLKLRSKKTTHVQTLNHDNTLTTPELTPSVSDSDTHCHNDDEVEWCGGETTSSPPSPDILCRCEEADEEEPNYPPTPVLTNSNCVAEWTLIDAPQAAPETVGESEGEVQDKGSLNWLVAWWRGVRNSLLICRSKPQLAPQLLWRLLISFLFLPLAVFFRPFSGIVMGRPLSAAALVYGYEGVFAVGKGRVPMFYFDTFVTINRWVAILPSTIAGVIFGSIHLTLWRSSFPTPLFHKLWKWSAVYLTVQPVLVLAIVLVVLYSQVKAMRLYCGLWYHDLALLYVIARGIVIYIAFSTLSALPDAVYYDIQWADAPHVF